MYENLCQPCISKPTRIVGNQKPSLIDNIFVNTIESPICGNLIDKISDHLPNFIIENQDIKEKTIANNHQRDTKNYNPVKFHNELVENFPAKYASSLTVNELSKTIITTLIKKHSRHNSPMKQISKRTIKSKQKPWITQRILKSIRTKTKWYKKFMKTRDINCRDRLNSVIRSSKKSYYKEYFLKHQNNSKVTWKGINPNYE